MGRTLPTYRTALESMIDSWDDYRRALSKEDKEAFDEMISRTRLHSSASTNAAFSDPFEGAVLSILLEQEKEIHRLRGHG